MYYLYFRKAKFKKIESRWPEANAFLAPFKNSRTTSQLIIRCFFICYVKIQLSISSQPIGKVRSIIEAIF